VTDFDFFSADFWTDEIHYRKLLKSDTFWPSPNFSTDKSYCKEMVLKVTFFGLWPVDVSNTQWMT